MQRRSQECDCSRHCFELQCVPALAPELNFPANSYFYRRSQQAGLFWSGSLNRPSLMPILICQCCRLTWVLLWSLSRTQWCSLFSFLSTEPISKPVLSSLTSQAKKGQNVTLSCLSVNGSLPITYIFFKGKRSISQPVKMQKREAAMIFLFINSSSDFGTYKCRAENSFRNNTKYSNSFNFTLAGMHAWNNLPLSINRDRTKCRLL